MSSVVAQLPLPKVRAVVAIAAGGVLLWFLVRRIFGSDDDPSLRYQSSNAGGTTSILLSGSHVTLLLAGIVAVAAWPVVSGSLAVMILLVAAPVAHYLVEKREDMTA